MDERHAHNADDPDCACEGCWLCKMLALEEELGAFPPGGAAGGVVAKHRREQAAKAAVDSQP